MGKIIDITEKLNFEEEPVIKVKELEIKVNADAATMLKIMGILSGNEAAGPKEVIGMYELIFTEQEREKIEKMKLNFKDFQTVIFTAINLVTGEESQGEQ